MQKLGIERLLSISLFLLNLFKKHICFILGILFLAFFSVFLEFIISFCPNFFCYRLMLGSEVVSHFIFEPQIHNFLKIYLFLTALAFIEFIAISYFFDKLIISKRFLLCEGTVLFLFSGYLMWILITYIGETFINFILTPKIKIIPLLVSIGLNWLHDFLTIMTPWNSHVNFKLPGADSTTNLGVILLPLETFLIIRIIILYVIELHNRFNKNKKKISTVLN